MIITSQSAIPNDCQIEANRNNALRSTGPRTGQGKVAVSQNAITHGLLSNQVVINGESRQDFEDFRNRLISYFQPVGELEQLLADRISAFFWRLNRAGRIEVEIIDGLADQPGLEVDSKNNNALPFKFTIGRTYIDPVTGEVTHTEDNSASDEPAENTEDASEATSGSSDVNRLSLGKAVSNDLAGHNVLGKFRRYEAHIDRTLYRALHELQRLQAVRKGQKVEAPAVLDINMTQNKD